MKERVHKETFFSLLLLIFFLRKLELAQLVLASHFLEVLTAQVVASQQIDRSARAFKVARLASWPSGCCFSAVSEIDLEVAS